MIITYLHVKIVSVIKQKRVIMRIGIIGAGNIVKCCLDALNKTQHVRCESICVLKSDLDIAQQYQAQYDIRSIYTEFDHLLNDPNVDIVYLGIPNKLHFAYALKALHVITSYSIHYTKLYDYPY